jgi:hypothetical protein
VIWTLRPVCLSSLRPSPQTSARLAERPVGDTRQGGAKDRYRCPGPSGCPFSCCSEAKQSIYKNRSQMGEQGLAINLPTRRCLQWTAPSEPQRYPAGLTSITGEDHTAPSTTSRAETA